MRVSVLAILAAVTACSNPAPRSTPVVSVTVAPVRRGPAPRILTANGQIEPLETARVAAQVSGLVTVVTFREGDWVRQGEVLFRIDPTPYAAALAAARAALARDTATASYTFGDAERLRALAREDYATKAEAESGAATASADSATVAADRAGVAKAQFDLANTIIRAPISGRTGSVLVRRGNLVGADTNQPLVVINRIDPLLVRFNVPAFVFADLQIAGRPKPLPVRVWSTDAATIAGVTAADSSADTADTATIADAQGTLTFVDNAIDTTTGTVRLKAQLGNHDGHLWPGQFVSVSLQVSVQQNALLIPSRAVQLGEQPAVYVVQPDGQAVRRPVTLGSTVGRLVVLTSGVVEGERVITDGQALTAGARVRVAGVDSTAQLATAP